MIQINELRIGNIIQEGKIEQIDNSIDEVYYSGDCYYQSNYCCNINPFPITEEWLLKFGFEKIIDNEFTLRYDLKKDERFDYFFPKHNLKSFGMRFQGACFFDVVKNVHQLQNIYFALTGKELTIN